MKKLLAIGAGVMLSLCAAFGASACSGKNENTLVIGYTEYAPMNYYDENNNFIGFDTEFAETVCAALGYQPKFQLIDWDNKIEELETKKIDLIWNGMTITDELKASIAISDPYLENKQVVVTKSENAAKFTDVASVAATASIAVESGSAGQSVAEDNGWDYTPMTAQSDCLLEVKTERSEIAIIDITMAKAMTGAGTDYTDLTYIDVGFASEEYGIGMRKEDTALLEEINRLIAQYKTDGTLDALIAKYLV